MPPRRQAERPARHANRSPRMNSSTSPRASTVMASLSSTYVPPRRGHLLHASESAHPPPAVPGRTESAGGRGRSLGDCDGPRPINEIRGVLRAEEIAHGGMFVANRRRITVVSGGGRGGRRLEHDGQERLRELCE